VRPHGENSIKCDRAGPSGVSILGQTTPHPVLEIPQMNIRIGKTVSLFALCLAVPMGIVGAQGTSVSVTCNDGTTSASVGKGACSGHGGVKAKTTTTSKTTSKTTTSAAAKTKTAKTKTSTKMEGGETKAAKAKSAKAKTSAPAAKGSGTASAADKDPKDATASCKDGTYSHAATHSGACSGHGGVLKFLKWRSDECSARCIAPSVPSSPRYLRKMRYAALLRGVNVGGHKKVSMAELRDFAAMLDLDDPRTVLQSGNLLFASKTTARKLESILETQTKTRFGLETRYFLRTAAEWQCAVDANPFRDAAERDPSHLVVVFLRDAPLAKNVKTLQAMIVGRETVRAVGREAYVIYPDGIGESRLTLPMIEKALGTTGTGRNWNTVMKINGLLRG
jgi:uncharacterized protein (DUF1697 family)